MCLPLVRTQWMRNGSVDDDGRGGLRTAPTAMQTAPAVKRKPIGRLIGAFKTVSTKRINEHRGTPNAPVWQRNYYEHIIRNEESLNRIRQYIADNPLVLFSGLSPPFAFGTGARY